MAFLEVLMLPLAQKFGVTVDLVNMFFALLMCFPMAYFLQAFFPPSTGNARNRHLTCLLFGLVISWSTCGIWSAHLLVMSSVSYWLTVFTNPAFVQRYVFLFSMGYLCSYHVYRLYTGDDNFDVNGRLMVMVQKVVYVAFKVHDDYMKRAKDNKNEMKRCTPSPIEYYGYVFNFSTLLVGPSLPFEEYRDFITGEDVAIKNKDHRALGSKRAAMQKALMSAIYLAVYAAGSKVVNYKLYGDPVFHNSHGVLFKLVHGYLAALFVRFRYVFAWTIAEAACNLSGLGFKGFKAGGQPDWSGAAMVQPYEFETSTSVYVMMGEWNIGTLVWLRKCVHERVSSHKMFKVLFISTIWHGFFPGYYVLSFAMIGAILTARLARRKLRPYFVGDARLKLLYDFFTWGTTLGNLTYGSIAFALSKASLVRVYLRETYLFWFILMAIAYAVLSVLPRPPRSEGGKIEGDSGTGEQPHSKAD